MNYYVSIASTEQVQNCCPPGGTFIVGSHKQRVLASVTSVVQTKQEFRCRFDYCNLLKISQQCCADIISIHQ